jgi:hypothetical protein
LNIREYISKQSRTGYFKWLAVCILLFIVAFICDRFGVSRLIFIPGIGLGVAIANAIFVSAKCPRCNYDFEHGGRYRIKHGSLKLRFHYCPHCGVSLNEEVHSN